MFGVLTFYKPSCDNVLEPEPQNTETNNISSLLYIFLSIPSSSKYFIQLFAEVSTVAPCTHFFNRNIKNIK